MALIVESNARLFIDLNIIKKNWRYLKKVTKEKIIGLSVKANCYGLGYKKICETLINEGCENFFVADAKEAIELRNTFNKINIFVLGGVQSLKIAKLLAKNKIYIVINNKNDLKVVKKYYVLYKKKVSCAIHFDTGMNRLGFGIIDIDLILRSIDKFLDPKLIMSHLSNSENKLSKSNKIQILEFEYIKKKLSEKHNLSYSLSNSNGIFLSNDFHFDLVRSGGLVFGLVLNKKKSFIKNVISLKAKIIQLRSLEQGTPIGYGSRYVTNKNKTIIATIGIGYADGLPRNYKGSFFIKGKKTAICGNMSMDLTSIDVTNIKNVKVNDWVEIFGHNISIEKFASLSDTISYDIVSSLGQRIDRIYLNAGVSEI